MWQSWVAIKHYSVVHFNHVTVFEALLHRTSVKGGADMHYRLTRYSYNIPIAYIYIYVPKRVQIYIYIYIYAL